MDQHVTSTQTETNLGEADRDGAPDLQRRTVLKQVGVAGLGALVGLQSGRARATSGDTTAADDTLDGTAGAVTSFDILQVDGTAGDIDSPQPVSAVIAIPNHEGGVEPTQFNLEVGDQPVDSYIVVAEAGCRPDTYEVFFFPPTQPEAGTYPLEIQFTGGEETETDREEEAIVYSAAGAQDIAVAQIVDESGSMDCGYFEPGLCLMEDARQASDLFVTNLRDTDSVSIVGYDSSGYIRQDLVRKEDGEAEVREAIENMNAGGGTNIGDGLLHGLETLEDAPEGATKSAILMTDGVLNAGPSEEEVINDIVPQFNEENICLYTIAFADAGDQEFMQEVADAADCGEFRFVPSPTDPEGERTLGEVYDELRVAIAADEQFAFEAGEVESGQEVQSELLVDNSVGDMRLTIQLATGMDDAVELIRPDGSVVDPVTDADVEYSFVGDAAVYRVSDITAGVWEYVIENPGPETVEYELGATGYAQTQTRLELQADGDTYYTGTDVTLTATLFGPDNPIQNAEVEATIEEPDGQTTTVSFTQQSPGVYQGTYAVPQEGEYSARVEADTDELTRIDSESWTVAGDPPLTIEVPEPPTIDAGSTEPVQLEFHSQEEAPDLAETHLEIDRFATADGSDTISASAMDVSFGPFEQDGPTTVVSEVDLGVPSGASSGTYDATVRVCLDDGSVLEQRLQMVTVETDSWLLYLAGLMGAGGAYYLYRRRTSGAAGGNGSAQAPPTAGPQQPGAGQQPTPGQGPPGSDGQPGQPPTNTQQSPTPDAQAGASPKEGE